MLRRVSASAHDCALIIVGSLPLLLILDKEKWRYALLAICFCYHRSCRNRSLGSYIAGLKTPSAGLSYCILYTSGFAAILYSAYVPFDILGLYVCGQAACLRLSGYTIPGYLTGYRPIDNSGSPHGQIARVSYGGVK